MDKIISKIIVYLTFILLILSAYLAFTGTWLANDINKLQMKWTGESKFYPILTMGLLFIPPMLLLLPIKLYLNKTIKKLKQNGEK